MPTLPNPQPAPGGDVPLTMHARLAAQAARALRTLPADEEVPKILVDEARAALRDLAAHMSRLDAYHDRRMTALREVRNTVAATLYDRARGVPVDAIAADARVGESQIRRIAQHKGIDTQRRPRKATRPTIRPDPTLEAVDDHGEPSAPNVARMYDYLLGGPHNFEADRAAIDQIRAASPEISLMAQQNREFLRRVVRHLTRSGIRQFLDLGTGIPSKGNVHEVAQEIDPEARVLYVDIDPVVLTYGAALLANTPHTDMIQGDMADPAAVLAHPATRALLDLNKPVAVIMLAVLHWLKDDQVAYRAVDYLREQLPSGSCFVISHVIDAQAWANQGVVELRERFQSTIPNHRTPDAIRAFFQGLTMEPPGLVPVTLWRHDRPRLAESIAVEDVWLLAGVGRKD